ncbi:hypothetical protein RCL_jg25724.t1 [Rhizophagus clarus]|uniref:Uncharacterized protein n=1 Tax=Rhizophagus clarus TaxID=94130 RepID=A0A8H3LU06_9GLOM|nr:hypothetical protein RCL_jg25724.t1 [Rhizophagus clarus]
MSNIKIFGISTLTAGIATYKTNWEKGHLTAQKRHLSERDDIRWNFPSSNKKKVINPFLSALPTSSRITITIEGNSCSDLKKASTEEIFSKIHVP